MSAYLTLLILAEQLFVQRRGANIIVFVARFVTINVIVYGLITYMHLP
jgi:hypothetical protein